MVLHDMNSEFCEIPIFLFLTFFFFYNFRNSNMYLTPSFSQNFTKLAKTIVFSAELSNQTILCHGFRLNWDTKLPLLSFVLFRSFLATYWPNSIFRIWRVFRGFGFIFAKNYHSNPLYIGYLDVLGVLKRLYRFLCLFW